MRTLLLLFILFTTVIFGQEDKINYTDSTGLRQGNWQILGAEVPEFGIEPMSIAEEGKYVDNQKVGPWIRFNKTGTQAISLIIYEINPVSKESERVSIHSYKYHSNGQLALLPYAGKCNMKANFKRFDNTGALLELMEYDSLGNEEMSITKVEATALAEMPYFQVPPTFSSFNEVDSAVPSIKQYLTENGTFIVDYGHTKFISGNFKDGVLVEGKECILDEMYSLVSARIYKEKAYVISYK